MPLTVSIGHASVTGARERNEDFVGMVTPNEPELSSKGLIAAVADGVSGNAGGREAAEYTVRGLLADYYATPDTWTVTQALERVLQAINAWVCRQGTARRELAGMATTLTALVLRGRFYYFAHVGDTRLYLLRAGRMRRLSADHVWDRPEMQHVLTRAIGLDARLAIDHGMGELHEGDVLLLASDGVWAALPDADLMHALQRLAACETDAQDTADRLIAAALAHKSQDNCSAVALRVDALPEENLRDALISSHRLPVPALLKPGQTLDGHVVESLIHTSRTTRLYRVRDPRSERRLVLKTLHPDCAEDEHARSAFAHEEWLARRAVARFFPQVIASAERNWLYYLSTWHAGQTLQQMLDSGTHFTVPEAVSLGERLARALGALHRRSILHRDIKPSNIHLGADGELRVLDFGVAVSGLDQEQPVDAPHAGTASFVAPEQFAGAPPSPRTDLYAAGVTLYHLLTRRYPYGEIEPFQHPRFGDPARPSRFRPDLPMWLENVLLKAVARDPAARFETAEEFLQALQRGAANPLPRPGTTPLSRRDPLLTWQAIAIASLVVNLLLLYLIALR